MNRFLRIAIFACSAALAAPALAQDFDAGLDAYNAGDYETAFENWLPLAVRGDASVQFALGVMYENGAGVPQDYAEAVRWYRQAAEQGEARAQFNLALMYANGEGVLQDNVLAHMWFNIASANGNANGGENRDIITKRMTREQIADAQARARVCMASSYQDCD